MIETILSKKIEDGGKIIKPSNEKSILNLKRDKIIKIFEDKGIILFRDFKILKEDIIKFINKFTLSYANDANRRTLRFNNNNIRNVDKGRVEIFIHSEASYSPSWPEVVWFYCNNPPIKHGQTTICDGNNIFKQFDAELKKYFLANEIVYKLKIPFGNHLKKKNGKTNNLKPWYIEYPGIKDCFINFKKNEILFKLKRYAVSETRKPNKISFCNHVQIPLESDDQLISIELEGGKKIPKKILKKVSKITQKLIFEIEWQKKDLLMIDNRRIMHGRRKIFIKDKTRDIVNIQTLRANFGYGSTTRI
tara:strand:- start:488 stop:1402 length:915 start_codon:yes stop_codon:yes gene_type:complete